MGGYYVDRRIVVLGAGYAGLLIAKKLEKKCKAAHVHAEITIIDKNPFFSLLTELHEVAVRRVDEENIRIDLKKVFAERDVRVVQDTVMSADYENNTLIGEAGSYPYDYLVLATGCKPAFFGVNGAEAHSFTLWSYDDAIRLRAHITEMFRQAYLETDPARKKELLNFYVVGGGFTGVEMVGELAELVPFNCAEFKIDPKLVRVTIVDVLDRLMTFIPEKLSHKAVKRLEKMGVTVSFGTKVVRISENEIELEKGGKSFTEATQTVIWAAGTEGSDFAQQSEALGLAERSRGRVQTDQYLRSLTHPNVYIAGDNIFYIPEGEKSPVPQMVENCEACAPVIAKNILSQLKGREPEVEYKPAFHGAMVCIGGRYGLAYVGMPNKMFSLPSFLAMFTKHFINLILFFQVLGWNKTFSYISSEFLTIRKRRSFVGGHFSNRAPTFFVVPLRIFLGIYFIYNAYVLYALDWLTTTRLRDVFYDVAAQFRPVVFGLDFNIFDRVQFSTVVAGGEMTMWLQSSALNWFFQNIVFASNATEIFFQVLVLAFLLLLGLAFMGGLFTTLASVGALFATLVVFMTVGLPFSMWWLPFAAIAMLFTGGKVLSLDYYVMPWLAKRWKKTRLARKWYLYHD